MNSSLKRPDSLVSFLGLDSEDFTLLDRYWGLFAQSAEQLARDFYNYLFSHPATAAAFRNFSEAQIEALVQRQAEHGYGLLNNQLNPSWQIAMQQLGAKHHHLGIDPAWLAGGYTIYWRHWQPILEKHVPTEHHSRLGQILISLLMGDLMSQLSGYARAARETDGERSAVFDVLLDTLASTRIEKDTDNTSLLQVLCERLPRKSRYITLAGYFLCSSRVNDLLTLEASAGLRLSMPYLPYSAEDPCWQALQQNQVLVYSSDDPAAPEWIRKLRPRVQEMVFLPFSSGDLQGLGFIGARAKGYFNRIGSDYFEAFAHLGEIVLQLRNRMLRDPLTQVPNRLLFMDRLEIARRQASREETLLGVVLLDLDGFKPVNDRFGHGAGDRLLLSVTQRIRQCLRSGDTLGRLGGDEFGLLFPSLSSIDDLDFICGRILETVRTPVEIDGEWIHVSASLGVTLYPLDEVSVETLLAHADMALYAAKKQGGDQLSLYSLTLDEAAQNAANMRLLLERGLKNHQLLLYYQPIVNSFGGVSGVESLLRILDPERGLLGPAAFWAGLDHHRYARDVGIFVMDAAFRQGQIWQQQGLALRVSVNISAHHLLDARFLDDLEKALRKYPDLPAEQIEIEITESAPLNDLLHAQERLAACNDLGVRVALDDFGTGNASLTYLQQLPAQSVKLDQSFVRDMINDPKDLAIVAAVITASRMLGLDVIAEGVETEAHAKLLAKMGCGHLQGYLFAKPMPGEDIPLWLRQFKNLNLSVLSHASIDILPTLLEGHGQRTENFLLAMREQKSIPQHVLEQDAEEKCHLGRWLKGDGSLRFGEQSEFLQILQRHEKIHHLARQAKLALDNGDVANALYLGSVLECENNKMIKELRNLVYDEESALSCSHGTQH
jgi:diguanylate cyclase (GGDEF)-like protein